MNIREYRFLLSERAALKRMIDETSASNLIGRMSLESRLRQVEEELETYSGLSPRLVSAVLTFRGRPVVENQGIYANFGTDAVNAFNESVIRINAGWHPPLPSGRRPPHKKEDQLLITGTATGSFGFLIQDATQQPTLEGQSSPIELAIKKVKEILEASVGTDEDLADAIADTDRRALDSVKKFLKTMADNNAICALEIQGDVFRFRDVAQVRRSEGRLSDDNILEADVTLMGQFQGFLPNSRRTEFYLSQADTEFLQEMVGTVVSGRVEAAVANVANINEMRNQDVTITAHTKRVRNGRPRFVITGIVE